MCDIVGGFYLNGKIVKFYVLNTVSFHTYSLSIQKHHLKVTQKDRSDFSHNFVGVKYSHTMSYKRISPVPSLKKASKTGQKVCDTIHPLF